MTPVMTNQLAQLLRNSFSQYFSFSSLWLLLIYFLCIRLLLSRYSTRLWPCCQLNIVFTISSWNIPRYLFIFWCGSSTLISLQCSNYLFTKYFYQSRCHLLWLVGISLRFLCFFPDIILTLQLKSEQVHHPFQSG